MDEKNEQMDQRTNKHSFTDNKNSGLFRDSPGPPRQIFQDLFIAHKCLNITKK